MKRQLTRNIIRCFAIMSAIYLSLTGSVLAMQDMFLRLGDIRGESQDSKHKDEIMVLSWSWGAKTGSAPNTAGGGRAAGRATFQDLTITKYVDRASPLLMRSVATGQPIKDSLLTLRVAGTKQVEFLRIKSADCIVTSVSPGSQGKDAWPTESVTLNCARHEYEYVPKRADGSPDVPIRTFFDLNSMKFQ